MVNSGNEKSIRISGLRSRPWDEIRNAANKRKTPPCSHELHPKSKARKQKPDAERAAKRELLRGVSKNVYKQKRPSSIFMEKSVVLPDFEFQSPVFRYEAPISSPSPSFTKRTSKETTCQARRFPDFSGKTRDYYFGREFSGDDLGLEEREAASANLKDNGHVVISPSSLISKVIHITPSSQHSEMDEEEVFGRAVALFIMAFQKFEKKLKLAAEKKCSEIIASVSEEIHLEVEDINRGKKTSYLAKTQGLGGHQILKHLEGTIKTKLDNASKRIEYVNNCAKRLKRDLKKSVREYLMED
ncbi:meiosis-specific protein ASY3-like isoform X2 [Arabidopsis lyrata subsp. lyrata]|uniref:meiosis-specific protein ASY3-like isoform X2 n=1 Tax=Arabidopsis lyrata subsp. lyrata TaxID=81972 RepID=UPI000A29AD12|nr:meiosis-specific protein ASY3-like isoform X2 [Arabidopsis lyrata subsp. lyrata]|eukprot:XP_020877946.1 meiosis-specific protein ASY3-like isoform X2 [Arabidopsis lyrata subsp. lyrata]